MTLRTPSQGPSSLQGGPTKVPLTSKWQVASSRHQNIYKLALCMSSDHLGRKGVGMDGEM